LGQHYTPQAHLKRFHIPKRPQFIWQYDKTRKCFQDLPINKVAQERDFYPADVEKELNELIEIPGNRCINKLLSGGTVTTQDRMDLSVYIVSMFMRGPVRREKIFGSTDEIRTNVFNSFRADIFKDISSESWHRLNKVLKNLDEVEKSFAAELPGELIDRLKTPFISDRMIDAIFDMTWELIPAQEDQKFITSDTPAHIFESLGVSRTTSEVTFTISKDLALIGHNQGPKRIGRLREKNPTQFIKEINRRIISASGRFIYSQKRETWIETLSDKTSLHLSLIRWS
jgi:hypothetical protein